MYSRLFIVASMIFASALSVYISYCQFYFRPDGYLFWGFLAAINGVFVLVMVLLYVFNSSK
jgi:hypothetical protein